jgi:hypothetical protein
MLHLATNISILIICLTFLILWIAKNWFFHKPKGYEITLLTKKSVSYNPVYTKSKISNEYPVHSEADENSETSSAGSNRGVVDSIGKYLEKKHIVRIKKD